MSDSLDVDAELHALEVELRKLEGEYNMYFAGRSARPPWETRSRVERMVKRLDRGYIQNYGQRFRFSTLQSRFAAFVDLWDRGLRAREEGRAGPFAAKKPPPAPEKPAAGRADRVLCVTAFRDPMKELDKLQELYGSLREARQELGEDAVPFHKFAELVKNQVAKLKKSGAPEVAFRVAVKDGKLSVTARALKDGK